MSLISKAPPEYQKAMPRFTVSGSPVFAFLETAQHREKEKKKKTIFPGKQSALDREWNVPQHAEAGSSAHSFTLTNCRVNPGAWPPLLFPLQETPGSLGVLGKPEARHPQLYSLKFIRHLPYPRFQRSVSGWLADAAGRLLVSNSPLTQTFPPCPGKRLLYTALWM